jgi:hypothetical protein
MTMKIALRWLLSLAALVACLGCNKKEEQLKAKAGPALDEMVQLVDRDVKQVRDGLPQGAANVLEHLDEDPAADLEGVRRAIEKGRASVHELVVAKSTFFVFVGPDGMVLRGEADPDLPAGKSLTEAIPDAKKILDPSAGVVEVWGYMEGLRGVNQGPDLQWVVGHPVKGADGKLRGAFVTGWSMRRYTEYVENQVKVKLTQLAEDKTKPIPLLYCFLVKGKTAYGASITPDDNAKLIGDLDVVEKAKGGSFETTIQLDGRDFFVAARPAPAFGPDVAVVVMLSAV